MSNSSSVGRRPLKVGRVVESFVVVVFVFLGDEVETSASRALAFLEVATIEDDDDADVAGMADDDDDDESTADGLDDDAAADDADDEDTAADDADDEDACNDDDRWTAGDGDNDDDDATASSGSGGFGAMVNVVVVVEFVFGVGDVVCAARASSHAR